MFFKRDPRQEGGVPLVSLFKHRRTGFSDGQDLDAIFDLVDYEDSGIVEIEEKRPRSVR